MKRLLRIAGIIALVVLLPYGCFCLIVWQQNSIRAQRAIARGVYITVSPETTVITQPLRKDGYVNYLGALNLQAADGVTPENNAAVLFWQAVGPGEVKPEFRSRFFQMLKMPEPPQRGNYFASLNKYAKQLEDTHDPRVPKPSEETPDPILQQQSAAMQHPWSNDAFPLVAAWLAVNEKPLALLVASSKRSRCYDPLLCGDSDEGRVLEASLTHLDLSREVGRALVARAMLRLKSGNVTDAWDDLLACHRFARLVGQGPTLIHGLLAFAIDGMANQGDEAVLQHARLTAAQAARMGDDLARLPALPRMVDKIDVSERYMFLDSLATTARDGFDALGDLQGSKKPRAAQDTAVLAALDWDIMLRNGNRWYDRFVTAGRLPTRTERATELHKLDNELNALSKSNADWKSALATIVFGGRSEKIGNIMICLMLPAVSVTFNAEDRAVMQVELTRLGLALAAYRADHGSYPKGLDELAPKYLSQVPHDIFADDGPLHYQPQGAGYLLYSVGPNGRDDAGRGREEGQKAGQDWDDLSVRLN